MTQTDTNPSYRNIVILTGAGISQESGLGTFRGPDGLWENVPIEDVATPEGFARDPVKVLNFYNDRRDGVRNAAPNPAHDALGRLQRDFAGKLKLVPQNIDPPNGKAAGRGRGWGGGG